MATYTYAISSIPGGATLGFTGDMSDHLLALIAAFVPAGVNPTLNSDGTNLMVGFDTDLSSGDKTTLDGLVSRCSEYLVLTYGNGSALPIDLEGPTASLVADGISTQAMLVQLKNGDGTNSNGHGELVTLAPKSLIPIDKLSGNLNGSGQLTFTLQTSNARGDVSVSVLGQYALPVITFFAEWA